MRHTLTIALLLAAAWPAAAQGPDGPPRMGPGYGGHPPMMRKNPMGMPPGKWWKDSEVVQKLGLTDAQVASIEQVFQTYKPKLQQAMENLRSLDQQLEPLMEADVPDEAKVLAQTANIAQARALLERTTTEMFLQIRKVLSPEQWKQLRAQFPGHPRRGFHEGPPPPRDDND